MLAKKFKLPVQKWLKEKKKRIIRQSGFFVVKKTAAASPYARFGVVISKKVSKSAVGRNKIKRIIFDFIRLGKFYETLNGDFLIIILPPAGKIKKPEIEAELEKLLIINH